MKLSVFIATSVDGYIARENGDVDFLDQHQNEGEQEDHGFSDFFNSVDALVMGRNSFEKVLSFGVGWPYGDKPVVVLSRKGIDIPDELPDSVECLGGPPQEIVETLAKRHNQKLPPTQPQHPQSLNPPNHHKPYCLSMPETDSTSSVGVLCSGRSVTVGQMGHGLHSIATAIRHN